MGRSLLPVQEEQIQWRVFLSPLEENAFIPHVGFREREVCLKVAPLCFKLPLKSFTRCNIDYVGSNRNEKNMVETMSSEKIPNSHDMKKKYNVGSVRVASPPSSMNTNTYGIIEEPHDATPLKA